MRCTKVSRILLPTSIHGSGKPDLKYLANLLAVNCYSIRFAAPPIGDLRWQLPQPPAQNRSAVIQADQFALQCPQNGDNGNIFGQGAATAASESASEDCLFLNVYAPSNATNLPVLVWIHGGGYGVRTLPILMLCIED